MESKVHAVMMKMKNKHCKLNIIPTSTLKQILEACLPAITQIVNLSLTNGEFCEDWKVAVVKPLLKIWSQFNKQELSTHIKPAIYIQASREMHA